MINLKLLSVWTVCFFAAFCQPVWCTCALETSDSVKVVAVQYKLEDHNYENAENFERSIDVLLTNAAKYSPDLVVFPEYIGLFLAATSLSHQDRDFFYGVINSSATADYAKILIHGILLSQCRKMNKIYVDTFSKMARKHKVFIAAGTIPECDLKSNLYNVCFVFNPEGKIILRQQKMCLVPLEGPDGLSLSCGKTNEWGTFLIKGYRVGVLICLDAFKPDAVYQTMRNNAEIIINPVANPEQYTPMVEHSFKSGLWTIVQNSKSVKYGVMSCLVGTSYPWFFEGQSAIIAKTNLFTADHTGYIQKARSSSDEELLFAELKMSGFSLLAWNIGCADLKASPALDRYLAHISSVINELAPDVVALQEQATPKQFEELLRLLKGRYKGKTTATNGRGVSLLSRLPITKWEIIRTHMGWDLLAVEIETTCLKKKCYVVSCYAPAGKNALNRNKICAALMDWVKSKNATTFLVGDFNFAPDNWLDRHTPFFSDNPELDGKTYNHIIGFADDLGKNAGATALLNRRIDYIFACPKGLTVREIQVIKNKRTGFMDHNPVFVRVAENSLEAE